MDEQIAAFVRATVQAKPPADLVPYVLDAVDDAPPARARYAGLLPAFASSAVLLLAIGAALLLWRPWGVADLSPSPSSTPSHTAAPSPTAAADASPTQSPPADALLEPGKTVELAAVDPQGEWGTIRIERREDLGGYTDADVGADSFIIELFIDYEADRLADPEEFGLPDWSLRPTDSVGGADGIFPIEPTRFDRYPTGFRPDTPLATYPGAIDIFSTPTEGNIAFEVPRDAAGLELELVYSPAGQDEPAATMPVRRPGEPPEHIAMEEPRAAPEPPQYVAHPEFSITVIESAEADDLFGQPDTCTNPVDGYSVTFPDDWYTNTETGDLPACSWFTPEFFEVTEPGEAPDQIWISSGVTEGAIGYIGTTEIYSDEAVTIDGFEARRVEYNPNPMGDPEYRRYHYTIILDEGAGGPTFVAGTDTDMAGDYELARAILDRIMASLEFDR
jgi:hypothetical protein